MFVSSWRDSADSSPDHTMTATRAAAIRHLPPTPISVGHAAEKKHSLLGRIRQVLALWRRRHQDRAVLRSLSPRQVADFCPRQADVEAEMNKPFWRA